MSTSNRRKLLQNTIAVNVGCSCRRLKLADIFRPNIRRPNRIIRASTTTTSSSSRSTSTTNKKKKKSDLCNSSTSSWDKGTGLSTLSLNDDEDEDDSNTTFDTTPRYYSEPEPTDYSSDPNKKVKGYGRINESLAIEKDSDDPYVDFRHSMLQMILEKQIYSRDDLRELLQCFLSLNSPYHHEIIIQVFTEIWNGVFSVKPYNNY
ncbi:hypothetical protein C5167_002795 [Papaver somniferum]|uniref:Transcription repressor n=1 Tax=Papaver somniferum TaxID=3469 RepID=A0A4Y7KZ45_PAPSO|nr:transcription repressor OFP8-like [Papaver somniferum]RZC78564.1 hypothetical protein C5167_002795 [Papaver somniferum]